MIVDGYEHSKTGNGEAGAENDIWGPDTGAIGGICEDQSKCECSGEGWDSMQLSLYRGIA